MRAGMFIVVPSSRQPRDTRAGSVCLIVYPAVDAGARGNLVETAFIRNRRLANDFEREVQTSETFIAVAATCLLLRRLAGFA
jgi:hypothetical protein